MIRASMNLLTPMSIITSFSDFFRQSDRELSSVDALTSSIEVAARMLMETHVIELIPVLGLAVKGLKVKDAVSDHLLANKLTAFLQGTGTLSREERECAAEGLFKDKRSAQKSGEKLLMVLDRMTDAVKPELLGKLFKRFAGGYIDTVQLRRLSMAVEVGFVDDFQDLLNPSQEETLSDEDIQDCRRRLVHTGLTAIHVYRSGGGKVLTHFQFTKLGLLFYEVVNGKPPSLACDIKFALTNELNLEDVRRSVRKI